MSNFMTKQATLVSQAKVDTSRQSEQLALFNADGQPVTALTYDTGGDIVLTGYTVGANTAVLATDTVNQAMGKLQAQLTAALALITTLQTTVADHETRIDALETP